MHIPHLQQEAFSAHEHAPVLIVEATAVYMLPAQATCTLHKTLQESWLLVATQTHDAMAGVRLPGVCPPTTRGGNIAAVAVVGANGGVEFGWEGTLVGQYES